MSWKLRRRRALGLEGQIDDFIKLEMVLRFNGVSTWTLDLPADGTDAAVMDFDGGLVVSRDGQTVMSGPVAARDRVWNAKTNALTLAGVDDTVWLARRLALPDPAGPPYDTQAYDVRTGPAETVMHGFVDYNAGPSAKSERQVPGLILAPDLGRGTSVTGRGRFHPLHELLPRLALAGGDLGFRIVQDGDQLLFEVYEPSDLTGTAKFSEGLGNLAELKYFERAPAGNYAYVAGGGEGTARVIVEGGDSGSIVRYGRHEMFVDQRQTEDVGELTQKRDETLDESAARTGLGITPIDTERLAYGIDYRLGDRVTAIVDGTSIADVLREVHIVLDGDGVTVKPTIGTPGQHDPRRVLNIFDRFDQLNQRVGQLERR